MVLMFDFRATRTRAAVIHGNAAAFDRALAIQGFRQPDRRGLQLAQAMAAEEVAVGKAAPLQGALQKLQSRMLFCWVSGSHDRPHNLLYLQPASWLIS